MKNRIYPIITFEELEWIMAEQKKASHAAMIKEAEKAAKKLRKLGLLIPDYGH